MVLSAGELDLAFGFGRHAVAGRGTISPGPHSLQNTAIASQTRALKNQWAVHTPVGTDDESHRYFVALCRSDKEGIRCRESHWWLDISAGRTRTDMRHIDECGRAGQRP